MRDTLLRGNKEEKFMAAKKEKSNSDDAGKLRAESL
jgi:hypothetical protein